MAPSQSSHSKSSSVSGSSSKSTKSQNNKPVTKHKKEEPKTDPNREAGCAHLVFSLQHKAGNIIKFTVSPDLKVTQSQDGQIEEGDTVRTVNHKRVTSRQQMQKQLLKCDQLQPVLVTLYKRKAIVIDQKMKALKPPGYTLINKLVMQRKSDGTALGLHTSLQNKLFVVTKTDQRSLSWHLFQTGDCVLAVNNEPLSADTDPAITITDALTNNNKNIITMLRPNAPKVPKPKQSTSSTTSQKTNKKKHQSKFTKPAPASQKTQTTPSITKRAAKKNVPPLAQLPGDTNEDSNEPHPDIKIIIKRERKYRKKKIGQECETSNLRVKTHKIPEATIDKSELCKTRSKVASQEDSVYGALAKAKRAAVGADELEQKRKNKTVHGQGQTSEKPKQPVHAIVCSSTTSTVKFVQEHDNVKVGYDNPLKDILKEKE